MSCLDENQLAAYFEYRLSSEDTARLFAHVDQCSACERLLAAVGNRHSAGAGDAPAEVELPFVNPERYRLGGELARGGQGRILEATDLRLRRPVALKELLRPDAALGSRFVREALLTAQLQHPSIVPVYDAGRWASGEPFFAMKQVSGRPLEQLIAERGELDQRLALLPNLVAVADAIAYAHSQGIIHRDLKPANVLVGEFGETVVIDWGLAKQLGSAEDPLPVPAAAAQPGETVAGSVLGTPAYMSPEQARGEPVSARADVYAIGAILYHVLAGAPPFSGAEVLAAVRAGPPPPLGERQPGVPRELATIVAKAMARDPVGRYPSALELASDLKRFQTGRLVGAHHYSRRALLARWLRRHRAPVAVAAVALVVVALLSLLGVRRILHERDAALTAQRAEQREQRRALSAERDAVARADTLKLAQARAVLDRDPTEAAAWLRSLSPGFWQTPAPAWGAVRTLAAAARAHGIARHVLRGHTEWVNTLAYSADGKHLASAGAHGELMLWDLATGRGRKLDTPPEGALLLAFSPDGTRLVVGGEDRAVRVWDVATGQGKLLGQVGDTVEALAFAPDGLSVLAAATDQTLRRWNLATGAESRLPLHDLFQQRTLGGGRVLGRAAAFSQDGTTLATSGGADAAVLVWDVASGRSKPLLGHEHHGGPAGGPVGLVDLTAVDISADGGQVVSAAQDATVRVWNVVSGQAQVLPEGRVATRVVLSPDWRLVATTSETDPGTIRLWDLATGRARDLKGHDGAPNDLAFLPGGLLASVGRDSTVRIWDLASGEQRRLLTGHTGGLAALALSTDGQLATGGADHTIRIWRPSDALDEVVVAPRVLGHILGISADGARVAFSVGDQLGVWEPASGALTPLGISVIAVNFTPDGQRLVLVTHDARLLLRELGSGQTRELAASVIADGLRVSPDGQLLAEFSVLSGVNLLDLTGAVRFHLPISDEINGASFSPDSGTLALAIGGKLVLVDTRTGQSHGLTSADAQLSAVTWSPDGRTLWTGDAGGRLRSWDPATLAPLAVLSGPPDLIAYVRCGPRAGTLVSVDSVDDVRLWDLSSGESRVLRHEPAHGALGFDAAGDVVTASAPGVYRRYRDDLPSGSLAGWLDLATDLEPEQR